VRNSIIIIIFCNNNFSWKYWDVVGTKLSGAPGDPITGMRVTEGPLYHFFLRDKIIM